MLDGLLLSSDQMVVPSQVIQDIEEFALQLGNVSLILNHSTSIIIGIRLWLFGLDLYL